MNRKLKKLAIVRTSISHQSITHYNSQELGLALELSKKGVFVDIFYASTYEKIVKINDKVKIIYLDTITFYKQQGLLKRIKFYLRNEKYNLIQVSEESMLQSVVISEYAKKLKIPVILLQGMYQPYSGLVKQIFQKTYNFFLLPILRRNIELAICKTNSSKNYLIDLNFKKIKVIPIGFNSSILNPEVNKINDLKRIDLSKKIILYIGKIEERRNPEFILDLAKQYENDEDILFVCIGNGDLESKFIKNKGSNVLHFSRIEQNQLQFLYNIAKVFIMPTNYEIFGMVYLECMYFGVPVITTSNAGSKDLFKNDFDSFIMNSLDVKNWKKKIDDILFSDKSGILSQRLKTKSNSYSWSKVSQEYYRVYEEVIISFNK